MLYSAISWSAGALTVSFSLLYLAMKRKYSESPLPGLPMAPIQNWLLGSYEDREMDLWDSLHEICGKYANASGVTAMWYFGTSTATVCRWQDARAILQSTPARMNMPKIIRKHLEMLTGPRNILLLEGREWKYHRSAIVKALGPNTIKKAQQVSAQVSHQMAQTLREKCTNGPTEFKLRPLMQMLALDVFGLSALDFDFKHAATLQIHSLADAFQFMTREYDRRMKSPVTGSFYCLPTGRNREFHQANKKIRTFVEGIIQNRADSKEADDSDFLGILLKAREELKKSEDGMSDKDIEDTMTDLVMTLLFAGHDTTANSLSYTLYEIARNPSVEVEILKEVERVFPDPNQPPDPNALVYTNAAFREGLRLYPAVPGMVRTLTKPVEVGEGKDAYALPIGTYTYMPFFLFQRDNRNFARATEMLPDRWVRRQSSGIWVERPLNDSEQMPVPRANPNAFFTFSTGGRNCPGQKFALQEGTIALANLVRYLKFDLTDGYELHIKHTAGGQGPSDNMPILLSSR